MRARIEKLYGNRSARRKGKGRKEGGWMNGCDYKEMIEGFEDRKERLEDKLKERTKKERLSTYEVKKA